MMTVLETLRAMRVLLDRPESWTKDVCARDASGKKVDLEADRAKAVSFCLIGAAYCSGVRAWEKSLNELDWLVHPLPVSVWQDEPTRTHAEVLNLLDRAIATEESKLVCPNCHEPTERCLCVEKEPS